MAGQTQRGPRDHGRSSRGGSPLALAATASAGGPGSEVTTSTPKAESAPGPAKAPTQTPRAVSRLLQIKGMKPGEAASLTAFLYGLPTSDLHWTLPQLNQLLFLQRMRQLGRFGGTDGERKLTH